MPKLTSSPVSSTLTDSDILELDQITPYGIIELTKAARRMEAGMERFSLFLRLGEAAFLSSIERIDLRAAEIRQYLKMICGFKCDTCFVKEPCIHWWDQTVSPASSLTAERCIDKWVQLILADKPPIIDPPKPRPANYTPHFYHVVHKNEQGQVVDYCDCGVLYDAHPVCWGCEILVGPGHINNNPIRRGQEYYCHTCFARRYPAEAPPKVRPDYNPDIDPPDIC
jgi:hypothetical protein